MWVGERCGWDCDGDGILEGGLQTIDTSHSILDHLIDDYHPINQSYICLQ